MSRGNARVRIGFVVLVAVLGGVCLARMVVYHHPETGLSLGWPDASIMPYRATPLAIGLVVGAALSVSGVLLQALLRNPLASPFILGVSSGAALGVILSMYVGSVAGLTFLGSGRHGVPALAGAVLTLIVVFGIGRRRGWLDPVSLILTGVIVSTICGAWIMLLQHLVPHGLKNDLIRWLMGHVPDTIDRWSLVAVAGLTLAGVLIAWAMGRAMDVATLGDDEARSVGLQLGRMRLWLFLLAGALAAGSVALVGPISFVGLVGPHAARLILGPRHRPLVVGAALCGMILIVGADTARQAIDLGTGRLPTGVLTALIGGPAFIWLLKTGRGQA